MAKIVKNRSDAEMFAGYVEPQSFEAQMLQEEEPVRKTVKKEPQEDLYQGMLTKELQEKVGRALVEQKLALYKQGIVDYGVKVELQGDKIILTAAVKGKKGAGK